MTRLNLDLGFIPLDNSSNLRPDWAEYWPIREFFLKNYIENDVYYGFFSPKFFEKTKLESDSVFTFIENENSDIISFSPYFDQAAFAKNIFEQGEANHRGIYENFRSAFHYLEPSINIDSLIMTSHETIFCNYFVAKGYIWRIWRQYCERIFEVCENNESSIGREMNSAVIHRSKNYPAKIFIIERMISFLIQINRNQWKISNYDMFKLPFSNSEISKNFNKLIQLDALKTAYRETLNEEFLLNFFRERNKFQ